jgi:hypothetical protein
MVDKETRFSSKRGTGILIPLLILVVAILVILFKFPYREGTDVTQKDTILFSFDDFHNIIGGNDQISLSQKKELFSEYAGKYVNWVGEVIRIEKQESGDLILRIKHLPETLDYDVSVSFDISQKEKLDRISPGSTISYSGKLFRFEPPSQYYLLDGDIR